jgi:hypothetical protein
VAQNVEVPSDWTADRVAEVFGSPAASEARHRAQMKEARRERRRLLDDRDAPLIFAPIADLSGELVEWSP